MRITEKILVCLAIIAILMKLADVPGNGILITLALTLLSCMYQFFGFALFNNIRLRKIFNGESYRGIKGGHIVYAVFAGFTLGVAVMAILFFVQHWPGAAVMYMAGFMPLLVISGFAIAMTIMKVNVGKNVLWRLIPVLLLYAVLYFNAWF